MPPKRRVSKRRLASLSDLFDSTNPLPVVEMCGECAECKKELMLPETANIGDAAWDRARAAGSWGPVTGSCAGIRAMTPEQRAAFDAEYPMPTLPPQ